MSLAYHFIIVLLILTLFGPQDVFANDLGAQSVNSPSAQAQSALRGPQGHIPAFVLSGKSYNVEQFSELSSALGNYEVFTAEPFFSKGELRKENIESLFGPVNLAYPASLSSLVANTVKPTLHKVLNGIGDFVQGSGFPVQRIKGDLKLRLIIIRDVPWSMDTGLLASSSCNSAWTGPPATILIATDRLGSKCGRSQPQPSVLAENMGDVLLHELGHVFEYRLMGEGFSRRQRWHGEGFAVWFETSVADYLTPQFPNQRYAQKISKAKEAFSTRWSSYLFAGSSSDYLQSFARIAALAAPSHQSRLFAVYERMSKEHSPFNSAVERELGWNEHEWAEQTQSFLFSPNNASMPEQTAYNSYRNQIRLFSNLFLGL